MRIAIYTLLAICAVMMLLSYAVLVMASRAEERADRMYKAWKEKSDERSNNKADK